MASELQSKMSEIDEIKRQIEELKKKLMVKEKDLDNAIIKVDSELKKVSTATQCSLTKQEISRYSRQLILPEIGVIGQERLRDSKVLVVGTGGLGCPAGQYLAACGLGTIGFVDHDVVDIGNLHRQILHSEATINMSKVSSASNSLCRLNSSVTYREHDIALNSHNALDVIKQYDIVLDCTDNVATRYLLNDACVLSQKPLVSGSALRFEGQITVYNYQNGPCYRCLFPTPPPSQAVTNCSDGGVIGAVTGVIGSLQALEALKIVTQNKSSLSQVLLLFDGIQSKFRSIKLRPKQPNCSVCGNEPSIKELQDYELFCGMKASDKTELALESNSKRITSQKYKAILDGNEHHLLVDVRPKIEYEICSLKNSINIPLADLNNKTKLSILEKQLKPLLDNSIPQKVLVVCRRGNDSQLAVPLLKNVLESLGYVNQNIQDIVGGLHSWSKNVDSSFPVY